MAKTTRLHAPRGIAGWHPPDDEPRILDAPRPARSAAAAVNCRQAAEPIGCMGSRSKAAKSIAQSHVSVTSEHMLHVVTIAVADSTSITLWSGVDHSSLFDYTRGYLGTGCSGATDTVTRASAPGLRACLRPGQGELALVLPAVVLA